MLTLIYTSGTTGPPKGVQITHANICETVRSYDELIEFPDGGRIVSYLPMAHVAERNVSHYLPMLCGFTITCCPDPREVIAYLPEVRPTWFFAVPRIWEKLKAGLEQMLAAAPAEQRRGRAGRWPPRSRRFVSSSGASRSPTSWRRGSQRPTRRCSRSSAEHLGLDRGGGLQRRALRRRPPEVIEFFHALGIPLAELWGMSETTGAGTCNPPERIKIGTVGPPAPGVEIKLAEDGEVMIKGPGGDEGLPEPAREDRRDVHRGRLPAHRRHRRVRRGRIPANRRSKEGADHHRRGQEPLARQHRGAAEADSAGQPGGRDRRPPQVHRRAADARPRGGEELGEASTGSRATSPRSPRARI